MYPFGDDTTLNLSLVWLFQTSCAMAYLMICPLNTYVHT